MRILFSQVPLNFTNAQISKLLDNFWITFNHFSFDLRENKVQ
jgi:hypothetical protein